MFFHYTSFFSAFFLIFLHTLKITEARTRTSSSASASFIETKVARIECVDILEDLRPNGWNNIAPPAYASSAAQLPELLKNRPGLELKPRESGIFYFDGDQEFGSIYNMKFKDYKDMLPIFLYVKYYGYQLEENLNGVMVAYPPLPEEIDQEFYKILPPTANFTWSEQLIQIDEKRLDDLALAAGMRNFKAGEYFLVEKLIVSQGIAIQSMEQIKLLCPPREEEDEKSTTEGSGNRNNLSFFLCSVIFVTTILLF